MRTLSLEHPRQAVCVAEGYVSEKRKGVEALSTCRYIWWSYAKAVTREYPMLLQEYADLKDTMPSPNLTGMHGGSGRVKRPTEDAALRQLPRVKMREMLAVYHAIQETKETLHGDKKLEVINLVYWKKSHNLVGASMKVEVAEVTAKRWNGEFLRRVGQHMGLLDE